MKIAVLSGKGGTGKTMAAVNFAALLPASFYVDCDAEAPNGQLYFRMPLVEEETVEVAIPEIDAAKCSGCRACADFCRFNALICKGKQVMLFAEQCHSCGGCSIVCPTAAISEVGKKVGSIEYRRSGTKKVFVGKLKIGEASSGAILQRLAKIVEPLTQPVLIDCPPGADCSVMESVAPADFCLLMAEPTLFGLHNLQLVVTLLRKLQKPFAVIINKAVPKAGLLDRYCRQEKIAVLGKIPFSKELAQLNGDGKILVYEDERYARLFAKLWQNLERQAQNA